MGVCASEQLEARKTKKQKKQISKSMKKSNSFDEGEIKEIVEDCFNRFDKNRDGMLELHEVI